MKKQTYILFDIDDTILNFQSNEHQSLEKVFAHYQIAFTKENIQLLSY